MRSVVVVGSVTRRARRRPANPPWGEAKASISRTQVEKEATEAEKDGVGQPGGDGRAEIATLSQGEEELREKEHGAEKENRPGHASKDASSGVSDSERGCDEENRETAPGSCPAVVEIG